MATTLAHIQQRRKTAAVWTSSNEVLLASEIGVETDTGKWKLGDGTTAWTSLGYQAGSASSLAATYLAQSTAASTYLAQADAIANYAPATPLWAADYDSSNVDAPEDVWKVVQRPSAGLGGPVQADRLVLVENASLPGAGPKPVGRAVHFTLHPYSATNPGTNSPEDGDVYDSSGNHANRSEVYGRVPNGSLGGTPPSQWPDPVGSERWYGWDVLVPTGFTFASDTKWFLLTQWKGLYGGSPPLAIEIKRGNFRFGGARTNSGLIPGDGTIGAITAGTWSRLVVGIKHSTDPAVGWIEVWRDGVQAIARTAVATMDTHGGSGDAFADPTYLKQGIYRDYNWAVNHDIYLGPVKVGTSRSVVMASPVVATSPEIVARAAAISNLAAARVPDELLVGAITRNGSGVVTSAGVIWPDGSPGTFTTDTIHATGAINGYHITYGSPVTKIYTQPTITRDASGNATNVPAVTITGVAD